MTVSVLAHDGQLHGALVEAVRSLGYQVREFDSIAESGSNVSAAILDEALPNFADSFVKLRERTPGAGLIVLSGRSDAHSTVKVMDLKPDEVLRKPFDLPGLSRALRRATRAVPPIAALRIVGENPGMLRLLERLGRAAATDITLAITGEVGTGKSLLAQWVHGQSSRRHGPFIEIPGSGLRGIGAIAELCGEEQADRVHPGRIECADGGTLVIDGIEDLSAPAQEAILTLLQEGVVLPVGASQPVVVDARVIATARRPVRELCESGELTAPLAERIDVLQHQVPALRDRIDDIGPIARAFLARFASESGEALAFLRPASIDDLQARPWRGNVRELENLMRRGALAFPGSDIELAAIDGDLQQPERLHPTSLNLVQLERAAIARSLNSNGGSRTEAARALGISPRTLRNKIHKYGLA